MSCHAAFTHAVSAVSVYGMAVRYSPPPQGLARERGLRSFLGVRESRARFGCDGGHAVAGRSPLRGGRKSWASGAHARALRHTGEAPAKACASMTVHGLCVRSF